MQNVQELAFIWPSITQFTVILTELSLSSLFGVAIAKARQHAKMLSAFGDKRSHCR